MSASEKLKALEARAITLDGQWEMRRVMPQVVAVVTLAEGIAQTDAPVWGTRDGLGFKLQDALAALDEALG